MKTQFNQIPTGIPFCIHGELGDVDLIKIIPNDAGNTICVSSENGSYEKQKCYFVCGDQEIEVFGEEN